MQNVISEKNSATPSPSSPVITPSTDTTNLGGLSNTYDDPSQVFSVQYPNDFTLDTQDAVHPRLYKRGEMQRPQSEMSDGALLVFEAINLEGKTLEAEADARIMAATADGTSEIIQPKAAVTVNNFRGFSYEVRGLGSATNIVIQKDANSKNALLITYAVSDPQQNGYQTAVEAILSTIELLK